MEAMVDVRNQQERSRYEILLDGEPIGQLTYRLEGDTVITPHTEIDPVHGGHGYGTQLVAAALDDIRGAGRSVRPLCSFVRRFIATHPEYQDLLEAPR
jgi:predicted GNAT family acetyltransferase